MIRRYRYFLLSGLFALLFGPPPAGAQDNQEPSPPDTWSQLIDDLKKLTPGTVGDDFLESLKQGAGFAPGILITLLVVPLATYGLVRLLHWLLFKATDSKRWQKIYPPVRLIIWSASIFYMLLLIMGDHWGLLPIFIVILLGYVGKDGMSDLLSGLWLTIKGPYTVNDLITAAGYYGRVKDIGLRTTTIVTLDDSTVTIPNSFILKNTISNANSGAPFCMVVVELWLPIAVDIPRVRKIAYEAAISSPYLNLDRPVTVLITDHFREQLATVVRVKAYVLDTQYEKLFESDVTEAAKQAFCREGVYGKLEN